MRKIFYVTTSALLLAALPAAAQSPNPGQLLQGLLSGNQGQDQGVRDAFERGYTKGRQDQEREDRARVDRNRPPPPQQRGGYPDQYPNQGYQQAPPAYNR